ncbi:MAG: DUF2723 domain-containing protein, partial [candidate division Zixibacteria bacterium]|nr:DUF2723 domain-containing protein [candidate division Zixibacteria bacterium]
MYKNLLWCTGIFCVSLIVFSITLAPSIYWEDSAAFVTAANILGIPHSPSFPIYVMWGRLFTLLPIDNFAWPVHLMSAFWGSLSLVMVFILTLKLFKREDDRQPSIDSNLIATALTLFFGFSLSFWSQTFRAEVYTLNLFFTLCLIWLIVKWGEQVNESSGDALKYFLAFAFIWGLSACNHSLLVFGLAPAFLIFVLLTDFRFILRLRNILFSVFFGILGFSGYLFLLIRSQQNPALNWARPESWGNLWKVITKSDQLRESLNFSQLNMGQNLLQIFNFILSDIFLPVALAAMLGAFALYKSKPKLLALFTGVLAGNILVVSWAADFSVRNLDLLGYLLPGLFALTSFATVGVHNLWKTFLEWLDKAELRTAGKFSPLFAALLLILPLAQINKNFKSCDKSRHYITYQYGIEMLNRLPKGAVIATSEDNTLLPIWYLTMVEKYRTDVTAVPWQAVESVDYLKTLKFSRPELNVPAKLINHRWLDRFARLNPGVPVYLQFVELPDGESKLVPEGFFLK